MSNIMSIVPTKASTPTFENDDETATTSLATVTTVATSAVTVAEKQQRNIRAIEELKNSLVVEYNTLTQIIINTRGDFVDRETKTTLGSSLVFELISYQDSWVLSPNDDAAPSEVVKYSNDGKLTTEGQPIAEALDDMINNGYPRSAIKQRVVVVGAIKTASATDAFNDTLAQFDLSPSSRTMWTRYVANAAYGLRVGKWTEEQVKTIKASTVSASSGTKDFNKATFAVAY